MAKSETKKFYWLKLKRDFFKRHDIQIIEAMPNGKDYILFYLKMLLESIDHEGALRFSDAIPYNEQMLSVITNTNVDIVRSAMKVFAELNMLEIFDDQTIYMAEVAKLIGSETAGAERVRRFREQQKTLSEPKSNAERQRNHRAKKVCEEKQHIPYIEDYINKKRYGGNYYIVIKRDKFKCAMCGSIESLCVHHIDGYDELKPENNAENKMLTLCRTCHSNIHAGNLIPKDILESIDYFESNEMLPRNALVTNCNTEIEIELEKENRERDIDGEVLTAENPPAPPRTHIDYVSIQNLYNKLCPSFSRCTSLSDTRKKAIKARMSSGRTVADFEQLFRKAEASSFLKGANGHNWKATFDWLIKDSNMAKVLDGNYDDTKPRGNGRESRQPEEWGNMPWDNE